MDKGELTPKQKALRQRIASLSGKIGANRRIAQPDYDGREATRPAKEAFWEKLDRRVDPELKLAPDVRRAKAKKLWAANMAAAQLKRAQNELRKAG